MEESRKIYDLATNTEVIRLMFFILEEQANPESRWKDHFALQPTDWSMYPLKFNEGEIKLLSSSKLHKRIIPRFRMMRKDYKLISEEVEGFSKLYTFGQFLDAYLSVATRAYKLNNQIMMVPFGDFVNHSN